MLDQRAQQVLFLFCTRTSKVVRVDRLPFCREEHAGESFGSNFVQIIERGSWYVEPPLTRLKQRLVFSDNNAIGTVMKVRESQKRVVVLHYNLAALVRPDTVIQQEAALKVILQ